MVSTAFPQATQAGVLVLEAGGNAVDAACAAALALGVCEPQSSGLGGQTMMLIHIGGKVIAVDGSSRAPSLSHVSSIYRDDRSVGYRASTVPGTPATLWYVHTRYGTLPWRQICEPAVSIAREGYEITDLQHRLQKRERKNFRKVESRSGMHYFLNDGKPYKPGELFRQPELADLLELLSKEGIDEFYTGRIAKQIDADMRENGGLLRYDDLALVPWPIIRRPLRRKFRKLRVFSMPPPGAGRTLLFTLMMINDIKPALLIDDDIDRAILFVEIFRQALLERSDRPFDPNYYAQVTEKGMLDRKYARRCVREIVRSTELRFPIHETEDELRGETTHLSVIDSSDIAVSLTQSIERAYGSKAAADGLGFLYNNYLLDYEYKIPSHPFYLRPNTVPWATVAPTLIFRDDDVWMAVGSPGSERIFSAISQFLVHVIDEGMPLGDAVRAPRLHCSLGGKVSIEADRFPAAIVEALAGKGYRIDRREPLSFYLGAIHAVVKRSDGRGFQGVAEIRRDGTAAGY
jgi:gamma-glutamyltranspeptidase/glutathione hydrolase